MEERRKREDEDNMVNTWSDKSAEIRGEINLKNDHCDARSKYERSIGN